MSALWLCSSGADLVLWDKSVLCEETERGALGVAIFFWKVTPGVWGLGQERVLNRKGDSQQGILERNCLKL